MSSVLSVNQTGKSYGPLTILQDVSFILNRGDRVGLVGANGSGKSTLLRIIAGDLEADSGRCSIPPTISRGYLPQQPPDAGGNTLADLIRDSVGELRVLDERLRTLEAEMSDAALSADALEQALLEYGEHQEQFERRGGYDLDYRIDIVLAGLGITHLPRDRVFSTLSGGEKARVQLAALLLRAPDLLLLDEPTNHLDFASIEWLEGYLRAYGGSILVVSHDRHFLNETVNRIVEIDEHTHGVKEYTGNYDAYLASRTAARARWEERWLEQQEEIRELRRAIWSSARNVAHNRPARDGDKMAYSFFGGRVQGAISRNVRNLEERLQRIEADPVPKPPDQLRIKPEFDVDELRSTAIVQVSNLTKRFGEAPILDHITFTIGPRERIVLVGPNGAGKSTLLNIIAGRVAPDEGSVAVAPGVRLGYLDQAAGDPAATRTVLETFRDGLVGYDDEFIRDLFCYGLFTLDDLTKQVRQLSTGQRRKLQIARLVAERANVLLLDEPTNHLSFDILKAFEQALLQFDGPILAVSHDRRFIQRFGGTIWHLVGGKLDLTAIAIHAAPVTQPSA